MPEFQTVGRVSDFEEGQISARLVRARDVAIANVGGVLHAFDNYCTHEAVPLTSECGVLAKTEVICLLHGSTFDLTTGAVLGGPAGTPLVIHQVRVRGDEVQVALK
jgi:3-phenylpropionate/trans-cinnamate dioxygenase ferredoxin component